MTILVTSRFNQQTITCYGISFLAPLEIGSHLAQAGLELIIYIRLVSKLCVSPLAFAFSVEIMSVGYQAWIWVGG